MLTDQADRDRVRRYAEELDKQAEALEKKAPETSGAALF
jgi:hypothetical protein